MDKLLPDVSPPGHQMAPAEAKAGIRRSGASKSSKAGKRQGDGKKGLAKDGTPCKISQSHSFSWQCSLGTDGTK